MNQNYYKVGRVSTTTEKGKKPTKNQYDGQQKEQKKKENQIFKVETVEKKVESRSVSTLWGIYNLFQKGEIKSEELTGSTIYDLMTMLMKNGEETDLSLMGRYQTLQNTQGLDRFTDGRSKRTRTLNPKNYEKYINSKEK